MKGGLHNLKSTAIILTEIPLAMRYYPDTKKSASRIYHGNLMEFD